MTCKEIVEFLSEYLEGQLRPAERAIFEEHLNECGQCVAFLQTFKETIKVGSFICNDPELVVPEDLIQAILTARSHCDQKPTDS